MHAPEEMISFVARIWVERGPNGDPVWRGHVRHVQSGEERHFSRLSELCVFMEGLAGANCGAFGAGEPERQGGGPEGKR